MTELWEPCCLNVADWHQRIKDRFSFHEGIIAPAQRANLELLRERGKVEWTKRREKLPPVDMVQ